MQPNDVTAFIVELVKRLSIKSPKFFRVLQNIGIIAFCLGWIPDIASMLHITLPQSPALERVLTIAGAITWFMAKLPSVNTAAIVETKPGALPFTTKKQEQGVDPTPEETKTKIILDQQKQ